MPPDDERESQPHEELASVIAERAYLSSLLGDEDKRSPFAPAPLVPVEVTGASQMAALPPQPWGESRAMTAAFLALGAAGIIALAVMAFMLFTR